MKNYIEKIQQKKDLTAAEMEKVMQLIMSGQVAEQDIADFLLSLKEKGPSVEEITSAVKVMRKFVLRINTYHDVVLDTCGTGGDQKNTFNISTLAAFVIAAAGVPVAKHGNRSVSSLCGSADLLEALGVNLQVDQELMSECLDEIGISFLFAQKLHPAMKHVAAARKKLKISTIFNILGPLTNPAMATHQLMGVYSQNLLEPMAHVLKNLGLKKAMVVHGHDGLDEITLTGITHVCEFDGQKISSYKIDPQKLGFSYISEQDLVGGDPRKNAALSREILKGKHSPKRDIVILNAAAGLYVAQKVSNLKDGITLASEALQSGRALEKLEALVELTNHAK